jgi:MoxR-like ATPase
MAKSAVDGNWIAKVYELPGNVGFRITRKNAAQRLIAIASTDYMSKNVSLMDVTAIVPSWHLVKAFQLDKAIMQQSYKNKSKFFYSLIDVPTSLQNRNLYAEFHGIEQGEPVVDPTVEASIKSVNAVDVKPNLTYSLQDVGDALVLKMVVSEAESSESSVAGFATHGDTLAYIHSSFAKKPKALVMNEIHWKYLVRSVIRGRNVLMTGPSGTGKTLAAMSVAKSVSRQFFYFNLGATQDPRSSLIGNTHLDKSTGTYFAESPFIKAIRTPNAIILLDEISRAHPDAWNILMTVLDLNQRYLRLDEKEDSELVKVADGVSFIATANIGAEYTATRVIDKALYERFGAIIEMPYLTMEQETALLSMLFPAVNKKLLEQVATIADTTRKQFLSGDGKLSTCLSTRITVEVAGLLYDNFSIAEAAEAAIYPHFSADGGVDSERTFVKQVVQQFVAITPDDAAAFFTPDEMNSVQS